MGVYGMLAIGFFMFVARHFIPPDRSSEGAMKLSFWGLNNIHIQCLRRRRSSLVVLEQPTERVTANDALHAEVVCRFFLWQLGVDRHVAKL